jgi:hypothetical protein
MALILKQNYDLLNDIFVFYSLYVSLYRLVLRRTVQEQEPEQLFFMFLFLFLFLSRLVLVRTVPKYMK